MRKITLTAMTAILIAIASRATIAAPLPAADKSLAPAKPAAPASAAPVQARYGPALPIFDFDKPAPGGTLAGVFHFTQPYTDIKTFALSNPERFVVDVIGARIADKKFEAIVGTLGVRSVRAAQFSFDPDIVRIVFDLEGVGSVDVQPDPSGTKLVVREAAPAKKGALLSAPEITRLSDRVIVDLRFAKKQDVRISQLSYPPAVVIEVPGVRVENAVKRFPVHEGVVSTVTMRRLPAGGARVAVSTNIPAKYDWEWQSDGRLRVSVTQPSVYKRLIVVDAGHGGKDPGAVAGTGMREKDMNLDIARRLARLLRGAGARVVMTRTDDYFVELDERAAIANRSGADIFVSVHINAMPANRESVRGIQTFYFDETKRTIADIVMQSMSATQGNGDGGVYSRRYLVLRKTNMPGVLCEIGFITNTADRILMNDAKFRENAARGIFNGLETYNGSRGLALAPLALPAQLAALVPYKPVMFAGAIPSLSPATAAAPACASDNPQLFEQPDEDLIGVVRQVSDDDTSEDELLAPGVARPVAGSVAPAPQPYRKSAPTIIGE